MQTRCFPLAITVALALLSLVLAPPSGPFAPKAVSTAQAGPPVSVTTPAPAADREAAAPPAAVLGGALAATPGTAAAPVATAIAPVTTPAPPAAATAPATQLPYGKGMWIWQPEQVEGGDVAAIVARAVAADLTHLYVRTGSSWDGGFYAQDLLNALLPVAHAAGIRVYGWDFPSFDDVTADVWRAYDAITYTTPTGDRLDGFSADLETPAEGVHMSVENASAYGAALRRMVGPAVPLIATVPRPSERNIGIYPFTEATAAFDAIAPMVYWLNRQPDSDVQGAVEWLSQYGKPIMPVGQAYDGTEEGGRPGPTADEIDRFLRASATMQVAAVSFWSWQHASDEVWSAIAGAGQFSHVPNPLLRIAVPPALAVLP